MGKKINEATSTDIPIIQRLVNEYGWKVGDTLLYQAIYDITDNLKADYSTLKNIRPDIVLQDMNGEIVAVIENNLDKENKDLLKLRTIVTQLLKPRFLYACSAERILFYDNAWRGLDAGEFKQVDGFMTLEEMKLKIEQQKKIASNKEITIDTSIAGGFDPTVGKERYYQLQCIRTIIENYKAGKQKMLIHMATGLGKTRTSVALAKALLSHGLCKRILFVVDRRMLAKQSVDDGFALISKEFPSSWITTSNFRSRKHANIHVIVIDTLELIHSDLPSGFYDLIIVDECHRSINVNRKLIFDHFLCPRIGMTATPRIATPKKGAEVDEEDLAIIDTYKLFGCETGEPDFQFDMDRGISEGFLAPYKPIELKSSLVTEAEENGIEFDHVLDPKEKYEIALGAEKKLKLEQLNRKFISEENCLRIAEELKKNTQYGEKVILFGVSQPHCIELAKAINQVFENDNSEKPYYAEAIISENNELNETLKAWFKKPYQKPYVVTSVDILSTGVDIPCVRYIAFASLTKSVGKYIQMVGRGTRLDPKTGKFSFTVLDFVGLCKRMEDNGKGTSKENKKVVKPGDQKPKQSGTPKPKGDYFLIDNPDPANLIQRVEIHGDSIEIKDNIPIEEAKRIFEEELKKSEEPVMTDLKEKATRSDYQPTEEEIAKLIEWLSKPNTFLDEGHLQKMYDYPEGSAWDFLLHALGKKKIPTPKERIEKNYLSYVHTYDFSDDQIIILKKIKDIFTSNIASKRNIEDKDIFGNPIYERLIGSYDEINKKFDGNFNLILTDLKSTFNIRPNA
ncbi:DEAD/DEAH box helicase family protein [Saccharicrinis fermentans]|uniref:Type I restriction enzyme EcoKI subunit R n=1 Tax=Saccharicrinis fermentans DSM 9555 = JCM 21142 TaxID=869213 RepID=W7YM46_9BACT|nr:DEAD/DEAH box helicase family protein [Saccharicrinis fermentans]GAF05736.1 type I restriction enzyme EcoKI subunit R [Saccharicrinis fermentans DSM 9555 = JCM 21142]